MYEMVKTNFTHEIKRNVQLRDIFTLKNKQHQAGFIMVYEAQCIAGEYHEELPQNTLDVVIMQLRIQVYSTRTLIDVGTLQLSSL
jgi:hypothetical protein